MKKKFVLISLIPGIIISLVGCLSMDLTEKNCKEALNPEIVVNPEGFRDGAVEIEPFYLELGDSSSLLVVASPKDLYIKRVIPLSDSRVIVKYSPLRSSNTINSKWVLVDLKAKTSEVMDAKTAIAFEQGFNRIRNLHLISIDDDPKIMQCYKDLPILGPPAILIGGARDVGYGYNISSSLGLKDVQVRILDQTMTSMSALTGVVSVTGRFVYIITNDNEAVQLMNTKKYFENRLSVRLKFPVESSQVSDDGKFLSFGSYLFNVEANRWYVYADAPVILSQMHPGFKKATILFYSFENNRRHVFVKNIDIRLPE